MLHKIGLGKTCLIVGGGPSASALYEFDANVDIVIGLNRWYLPHRIDYLFHCDNFERLIDEIPEKCKVISRKGSEHKRTDIVVPDDIFGCHSGTMALGLAIDVMWCDKVYLIGYDYKTDLKGYIHYYGDGMTEAEKKSYLGHFDTMIRDFEQHDWPREKIANLNPHSALELFAKIDPDTVLA